MRRPRTPLRGIRLVVVSSAVFCCAAIGLLYGSGVPTTSPDTMWLALPAILGASAALLVPAVGSTVRPLPYGTAEAVARRIAIRVTRTVSYLRFGIAQTPALFGFAGSLLSASLVPAALGVILTIVLDVLVFPRRRVLASVRDRLESAGVASHLWDALDHDTDALPTMPVR